MNSATDAAIAAELYRWTTPVAATRMILQNVLKPRSWQHYIEGVDRYVQGTSWSRDPLRWKSDNQVCLVIDGSGITNPVHHINGNRVYLQTQGRINPNADPECYKFESTEPDESFIEGKIPNLALVLLEVRVASPALAHLIGSITSVPVPVFKDELHHERMCA